MDIIALLKELPAPLIVLGIILWIFKIIFEKQLEKVYERQKIEIDNNLKKLELNIQSDLKKAEESTKKYLEYSFVIDEDLRNKRIPLYKSLWKKTGLLPYYPKNPNLKYSDLHQLSLDITEWYFDEGGIYLSEESRKNYGTLQSSLVRVSDINNNEKVSEDDYDLNRKACSELRSKLTSDLNSRRNSV